jgi:vacuolar-type H+-ATPase subunit H
MQKLFGLLITAKKKSFLSFKILNSNYTTHMTATQEALAAMAKAEQGMNSMIDDIVESSETFVQDCKEQKKELFPTAFEQAQDRARENFEDFMQEREAALELDEKVSEAIWLLRATDPHIAKHLNDALGAFRNNKVKALH